MTISTVSLRYPRAYAGHTAWARRAAAGTLDRLGVADATLTVVLTDEAGIRTLNRQYAGNDSVTDVLSFPSAATDPQTGAHHLGDVIVAIPVAESQARAAGHDTKDEVALLVVHGVLHLLGYDHADPTDRDAMWSVQAALLDDLGAGVLMPPEEPS